MKIASVAEPVCRICKLGHLTRIEVCKVSVYKQANLREILLVLTKMTVQVVTIVFLGALTCALCKVYERCELARELRDVHSLPEEQIPIWICIARYESEFNTSAVGHANGDGSGDHGLFQISDIYWCSPPGNGWACGVTCADLEDDDIKDDVVCAKRIYRQHHRLSGNGFRAWAVYGPHCANPLAVLDYVEGCFEPKLELEPEPTPTPTTSTSTTTTTTEETKSIEDVENNEVTTKNKGRKFWFWS